MTLIRRRSSISFLVDDYEGGRADLLQPYPWQTDTCIGNWHYYRGIHYRTADEVVKELVDVVGKNGNLLLNVPLRGDGTPDDEELKFIADLTKWIDVNGEGIFGTRPWRVFGEGGRGARRPGRSLASRQTLTRFASPAKVGRCLRMYWGRRGRLVTIKSLGTASIALPKG